MTDIKWTLGELIADLRALASSNQLAALHPMFSDAAEALERQQAVVKAARGYGRGEHGWPGRLEMALNALDAPPEGEG